MEQRSLKECSFARSLLFQPVEREHRCVVSLGNFAGAREMPAVGCKVWMIRLSGKAAKSGFLVGSLSLVPSEDTVVGWGFFQASCEGWP